VVVLRDGPTGLEVYLQRRTMTMGFAAGLWVFPGGRVDRVDQDPAVDATWSGPGPEAWAARLGLGRSEARGTVVAACRECLEEAGVLLADRAPEPAALDAARRQLLAGRQGLGAVLAGLGVRLDTSRLRYWAWWVTPEAETRRYDTRFFVAGLPRGATVTVHGLEAERGHWLPVASAVAEPVRMLPPTWCTLRELTAFSSVAEVLAAADARVIERTLPLWAGDAVVLPSGERIRLPPLGQRAPEPPGAREARLPQVPSPEAGKALSPEAGQAPSSQASQAGEAPSPQASQAPSSEADEGASPQVTLPEAGEGRGGRP
jgi:8-oxo-dGTP pyrophosphatase MutT (NUDIX family)